MATPSRPLVFCLLLLSGMILPAFGAESPAHPPIIEAPRFLGAPSCMSASCHGGGTGKDQSIHWKKDAHFRSNARLASGRSRLMGEALGIEDVTQSARCTICHSPMASLPADRFAKLQVNNVPKIADPEKGVGCETCHGPAENYLRFHTRKDISHEQRISSGLRELTGMYGRAGTCVACHQNLDAELVKTGGHPEMFFELDRQMSFNEKFYEPHYKDEGTWIGPKAWATGQAVALREMSWKLSRKGDDTLVPRWKALVWLLSQTNFTNTEKTKLNENADYAPIQSEADRLARVASRSVWAKEKTLTQLRTFVGLSPGFRDTNLDPVDQRRRAEVLYRAVDRLWVALKKDGGMTSETFDTAWRKLQDVGNTQEGFKPEDFAAALEQLEVAMELWPKS